MSTSKKAEIKTKQNTASVEDFLATVKDESKHNDCLELLKMMKQVTKEEPMMWGSTIVGFGKYRYESPKTGRSGDWFMTGFSPRKQNLTIYFISGFSGYDDLLKKLGKNKTSAGSCLYINTLADVDKKVLKELITRSFKHMKETYSKK